MSNEERVELMVVAVVTLGNYSLVQSVVCDQSVDDDNQRLWVVGVVMLSGQMYETSAPTLELALIAAAEWVRLFNAA